MLIKAKCLKLRVVRNLSFFGNLLNSLIKSLFDGWRSLHLLFYRVLDLRELLLGDHELVALLTEDRMHTLHNSVMNILSGQLNVKLRRAIEYEIAIEWQQQGVVQLDKVDLEELEQPLHGEAPFEEDRDQVFQGEFEDA